MSATNKDNIVLGTSLLRATILPLIGGLVMPSLAASAGLSGLVAFGVLEVVCAYTLNYNALIDSSNLNTFEGLGKLAMGIALSTGTLYLLSMMLGQNVWNALAAQFLGGAVIMGIPFGIAAVIIGICVAFDACSNLYKSMIANNDQPNQIVPALGLDR